ncbi:MAG: TetR family transcriptional regulator [Actinomycetota bacterium]|nr:TetR family transcriptional regulator [Actinomycetota bacterium]MDA3011783.1 TetR family transcriptional regulator [Actinomycetota bacterium]MDA3024514.1 TetR family transcriptional regulator [Actinomycetota bacterium]
MSNKVRSVDGRVIGSRAQATRRRLLDATEKLLKEQGVFDLRVVDITREVGTSAATFYQYFNDADAAILALAEEAVEAERPLVNHLHPAWTPADVATRAQAFVDAYMAYWDAHAAVLRIRNVKAEEGDRNFRAVRSQANLLVIDGIQAMIADGVATGRLPRTLDPFTTGAALVAMIERLLGFQNEMTKRGSSRDSIRDTLVTLLSRTMVGN